MKILKILISEALISTILGLFIYVLYRFGLDRLTEILINPIECIVITIIIRLLFPADMLNRMSSTDNKKEKNKTDFFKRNKNER